MTLPKINLRNINNVLLIVVIVVNLYVIMVPFLPQLLFKIDQGRGKQQALEQKLQAPANSSTTTNDKGTTVVSVPPSSQPAAEQGNRLIIPSMQLDQPIVEGTNLYKALDQGVWHWPDGSTPDQGGNTVMLGHRFTYTKPKGVFYFLDKVHEGDNIGVKWGDSTYIYRVYKTETVPPTQTSILEKTEDPELTLYTCTPLWLPKNRLVVHASLAEIQEPAR